MCRKSDIALAEKNLIALQSNPYPGRGLVVGTDESGNYLVQIYWIMGRGVDSRNRIFSFDGGRLFTEAADPSQMKDPSLIIYNAMQEKVSPAGLNGFFIVSNGNQTDATVNRFLHFGRARDITLCECLRMEEIIYEPDAPNYTPRITAVTHLNFQTEIVVLRKSQWDDSCDCLHYMYRSIARGFGFCVTTYTGDGNPLPAFAGEPLLMPIPGDIDKVLNFYWSTLNEANRVSLAVKFISIATGKSTIVVTNKYTKVAS